MTQYHSSCPGKDDRETGRKGCSDYGCGQGIGQAMAILFAREGAKVVVVDYDAVSGQEPVEQIRGGRGEAIFVRAGVSDPAVVQAMVRGGSL